MKAPHNGGLLGEKFALARGSNSKIAVAMEHCHGVMGSLIMCDDFEAVVSLSQVRTRQMALLKSDLLLTTGTGSSQVEQKEKSTPVTVMKSVEVKPISPQQPPLSPRPQILTDEKVTLSQLLRYVVEGEQDKVEEILKKDKSLLLQAGTVTDLSGREFKQITAFQYALWAWDWHMWTMIRKHLPREAQLEQFQTLETKGTTHGKHFSLKPLTDAYMVYMESPGKEWNYDQRSANHWQSVVGAEQRLLPVSVINEFCRPDRPLAPCPEFTETTLPRSRECNIGDCFKASHNGGLLGEKFALTRGSDAKMATARGIAATR